MTVKTLIEKLSHYNKNAIVRLHHREGEELLFALAFQNDDTTVVLETENDNDMREEIQARFDAALEDGKDELDVYSEMLETGIDIKMVRKYLGDDEAILNRLLKELKNEDIKKGINIALSAYKDSGYMTYDDMYDNNLMDETVKGYLDTLK